MENEIMNGLMDEFVLVKASIKSRKTKAEALRSKILILLKSEDLTEYENDSAFLTLTSSPRKTFDKDKAIEFIESKGEDKETYYTSSEYETLKIKEKSAKTDTEANK